MNIEIYDPSERNVKITSKYIKKYKNGIYGIEINWTADNKSRIKYPEEIVPEYGSEGAGATIYFEYEDGTNINFFIDGFEEKYTYFTHKNLKYGVEIYFTRIDWKDGVVIID